MKLITAIICPEQLDQVRQALIKSEITRISHAALVAARRRAPRSIAGSRSRPSSRPRCGSTSPATTSSPRRRSTRSSPRRAAARARSATGRSSSPNSSSASGSAPGSRAGPRSEPAGSVGRSPPAARRGSRYGAVVILGRLAHQVVTPPVTCPCCSTGQLTCFAFRRSILGVREEESGEELHALKPLFAVVVVHLAACPGGIEPGDSPRGGEVVDAAREEAE